MMDGAIAWTESPRRGCVPSATRTRARARDASSRRRKGSRTARGGGWTDVVRWGDDVAGTSSTRDRDDVGRGDAPRTIESENVPARGAGDGVRTDGEPRGGLEERIDVAARSIRWTRWTRGGAWTGEGIHRRTLRRRLQGETRTKTRRGEEESVSVVVRVGGDVDLWTVCA